MLRLAHALVFFAFVSVIISETEEQTIKKRSNKFIDRPEINATTVTIGMRPPSSHDHSKLRCDASPMQLMWSNELDSSIYATPVITDIDGDGEKDIIIATYAQFVDILDGKTGQSKQGWPFSLEGTVFHSSPLVADVDGDGSLEVIVVSFNGDVVVLGKDGLPYLSKIFKIPKLKVRKDWYAAAPGNEGNIPTEFVPASMEEQRILKERAKAGIHSHHAHNLPILPFSDNEGPAASVEMPFPEYGIESFQELFDTPQTLPADTSGTGAPEHHVFEQDGFVFVDSHVLSSPVLADLDGDGVDELVIAVSYFFDKESFDYDAFSKVDSDLDLSKYIASGIVVMNTQTSSVKWSTQLDLTTSASEYRAYIYSTPTVADLDADGQVEVVVGTSMGYIYVLEHNGDVRDGFPVEMAEIQGQISLADVNKDGKLDLIVCDSNSNIAVFDCHGDELWERQLAGLSAHGALLADVNGDGELDVVVTTSLGFVFALRSSDGSILPNFPVKFDDRIISPVLPMRFHSSNPVHRLIVPVFDGHVYVIDGQVGCIDYIDVDEHSYTQVLADDLLGSGRMSLLVTTMNGGVYCFDSNVPYSPLRAWQSQNFLFNGFAPREGSVGVRVSDLSRQYRDIIGSTFAVEFEIVDDRPPLEEKFDNVVYNIRISVGQRELLTKQFAVKGKHTVTVPSVPTRMQGNVIVQLSDQHSIRVRDSFSLGFNINFYKTMKWLVVLPFVLMATGLAFIKDLRTPLPMY